MCNNIGLEPDINNAYFDNKTTMKWLGKYSLTHNALVRLGDEDAVKRGKEICHLWNPANEKSFPNRLLVTDRDKKWATVAESVYEACFQGSAAQIEDMFKTKYIKEGKEESKLLRETKGWQQRRVSFLDEKVTVFHTLIAILCIFTLVFPGCIERKGNPWCAKDGIKARQLRIGRRN